MTPAAKDLAARMLVDIVKLPIGERAGVLAMVIRVLAAPEAMDGEGNETETIQPNEGAQ